MKTADCGTFTMNPPVPGSPACWTITGAPSRPASTCTKPRLTNGTPRQRASSVKWPSLIFMILHKARFGSKAGKAKRSSHRNRKTTTASCHPPTRKWHATFSSSANCSSAKTGASSPIACSPEPSTAQATGPAPRIGRVCCLWRTEPFHEVVITAPNAKVVANAQHALQAHYRPQALYAGGASENIPLLRDRQLGELAIFVCEDGRCQLPVASVEKAAGLLTKAAH